MAILNMSEAPTQPDASPGVREFLRDLTEPQREAVTHTDGALLLLAGAGSGKTRVITRRAAHLATTVTRPWHVLAITFTNKAANEMKERIVALSPGDDMTVCTFHSLCARLLRIHHDAAGLPPNFTIVDQSDRRKLIKQAVERLELAVDNWRRAAETGISRAKNAMETPAEMADAAGFQEKTIARIYAAYEEILAENAGLDFDDLLFKMALLLQSNEEVRAKLGDRFRYVMIDEYQDTNAAQYRIANLIARDHGNIMVTGDPDQSIYSWRGADITNILSFEHDYPNVKTVRLEQNYRSTKRILSVAGAVIAENIGRKDKTLWTENDEGTPVRVLTCSDARSEAEAIVKDIESLVVQGRRPGDFAIFYRINAMSRVLEESLFSAGISYRIARGTAFYARKEIKDILGYLRVMVNPADTVALERIINTPPRGIGKTTINTLKAFAERQGCTLLTAVMRYDECGLGKRAVNSLKAFTDLLQTLQLLAGGSTRHAIDQALSLSGMLAQLGEQQEANPEPLANANELVNAAEEYDTANPEATLLDWLTFTSLLGDEDIIEGDSGTVTLMTLHAAKGLEFPCVYIIGLERGLVPLVRDVLSIDEEEEERRLFFVGMTRAMQRLTITHALWRMVRGVTQRATRSVFLDELPDDEIEWDDRCGVGSNGSRSAHGEHLREDLHLWEVGTLVRHPDHGIGQVMSMGRRAGRMQVIVRFEDGRERPWMLEFASDLERVDFDDVG